MLRTQKTIFWTILVSETGHVFCCALPVFLSVLSLFAAFGSMGLVPGIFFDLHELVHRWELFVICVSALLLGFGWWLHMYSKNIDCTNHGCGHPPCKPKKDRTHLVLIIASVLFMFNFSLYLFFHQSDTRLMRSDNAQIVAHDH